MIQGARYGHTNLIARDWEALVKFYESVFGCVRVPPERNFSGPVLEAGTGVKGSALRGMHLRLPGHGSEGPAGRRVTWCYVTDPEGNIIELQSWTED